MKNILKHSLIFDGTLHYIIPTIDLKDLMDNDNDIELIRQSNDFDYLCKLSDTLNEEI